MKEERYHYVECGLPNVWLLNGFEISETPYGEGVAIRDVDGLHRCIASVLCDKPDPLTGAEFRFLRREMDFSQTMLGELLGRTARQIRNIETEEKEVKAPLNLLIRHIYLASIDKNRTYLEVFDRLRKIDVQWHEQLSLSNREGEDWSVQTPPDSSLPKHAKPPPQCGGFLWELCPVQPSGLIDGRIGNASGGEPLAADATTVALAAGAPFRVGLVAGYGRAIVDP